MDRIHKVIEGAGLTILLVIVLTACGGNAEEGTIDDDAAYDDSLPAAEQPIETDAPGEPALPSTAVEEPDPENPGLDAETGEVESGPGGGPSTDMSALTDQSQAETRQRGLCEAQRASYPGQEYRVECTRAVTGDDRREVWQCTCVWGG